MGNKRKITSKEKKHGRIRFGIQLAAAALFNGYFAGFANGKLYSGNTKMACVPVLNCYSCPGAIGSCPIGAMQSVIGGRKHNFSFYVLGTIMLFGIILGRVICGLLCPFGFFQDLLHKIPVPKLKVPKTFDKVLRYLKYVILVVFVFVLPMIMVEKYTNMAAPYFCKLICPAGILEGALPLIAKNGSIVLGPLFNWKLGILIAVIVLSILIPRPFCKYLCPLGAFYGLFNRFALYQMKFEESKCVNCHKCEYICPMNVEVTQNINSAECIRCGKCKATCPTDAISSGFFMKNNIEAVKSEKVEK